MKIYKNSIWSFVEDKPVSAEHDGLVVVSDGELSKDTLCELLRSHDRVVTPTLVHDNDGSYDRQSGQAVECDGHENQLVRVRYGIYPTREAAIAAGWVDAEYGLGFTSPGDTKQVQGWIPLVERWRQDYFYSEC